MINIVIPMAGAGSRFAKAGFKDPKPLIKVHGVPMVKLVVNNLKPQQEHRFIFIVQKKHDDEYGLSEVLKSWEPTCEIVHANGLTEGAACTVLLAKEFINNESHLMIANSDQYVDCNINDYIDELDNNRLDGIIMTMKADDPKWSFVGFDNAGYINKVVEKEVISDEATVGIYNFRKGNDFVDAAEEMIRRNERVNNEFYVAPVYNDLIKNGAKIGIFNVGSEAQGMYGLGIPADLDLFLNLPLSHDAVRGI
ncbi:glycosyltransferase family 2 protein [Pantoea sp. Cy-640]|uniref:glycosyltransferase family 2 protein n=1 Tax=Pantoea sp. Cy-640 TaxID=2608353 RepID=UPI0014199F33|nr:glycosyltransferase family 2 protein [Pantoea sp. Cy-640]NIG14637.1 NTP transferase domain-containing protein [Pantoea sp. Cy-640]